MVVKIIMDNRTYVAIYVHSNRLISSTIANSGTGIVYMHLIKIMCIIRSYIAIGTILQ